MCSDFPLFLVDICFAWMEDVIVLSVECRWNIAHLIYYSSGRNKSVEILLSLEFCYCVRGSSISFSENLLFESLTTDWQNCRSIIRGDEFLQEFICDNQ